MRVTWWGHATATVDFGGVRVLTDPLFADRLVHLRRQVEPVAVGRARRAEVVVVSHLHPDHLHLPSLRSLRESTRIVAPRGTIGMLRARAADLADRVDEVGVGDTVRIGGLDLTATPANHDGRRVPGSSHHGPALGYLLRAAGETAWFAGDTGLFNGLDTIGPVDVALVPVGGWGPTLGPHHLDPVQATEAVRRVGAAVAVPVHYGTYWPVGLRRAAPAVYRSRCREPGVRFAQVAGGFTARVIASAEAIDL